MATSKHSRWKEYKPRHHANVLKAVKKALASEEWKNVMSDTRIAEAVMAQGVYASKNVVRDIRIANGIANSDIRKIELFAAAHKN